MSSHTVDENIIAPDSVSPELEDESRCAVEGVPIPAPPGLSAKTSDYTAALNQDSWTAREAIYWLKWRNPLWCRGSLVMDYSEETDLVKRAIKAGRLTPDSTPPYQWIEWAISKDWQIPSLLLEFFRDNSPAIKLDVEVHPVAIAHYPEESAQDSADKINSIRQAEVADSGSQDSTEQASTEVIQGEDVWGAGEDSKIGTNHPQQKINHVTEPITESQPKSSGGDGATATHKPRKKLKPLEREANEGLFLLYEIFKLYQVEYLDELPAVKAWGKIVSGEFTSDSIKSFTRSFIILSGGDKLYKKDFSNKYRKRFK